MLCIFPMSNPMTFFISAVATKELVETYKSTNSYKKIQAKIKQLRLDTDKRFLTQ